MSWLSDIIHGHNPFNHPPPVPIPLGPGSTGPGTGALPLPSTGQQTLPSTQPVYPNFDIPGVDSGGIDWGSVISKIPGWVIDGIKAGLPAAIQWFKDNSGSLIQGAALADAVYRQTQSDKYAKQALSTAEDAYNAKAPLRSAGIQGMLTAGLANPFARGSLPLGGTVNPTTPSGNASMGLPADYVPGAPLPPGVPSPDPRRRPLPLAPSTQDPRRIPIGLS